MSHVIDTQHVLWSLIDPSRLPARSRRVLGDQNTLMQVSTVSFWEISLKYSIGKLALTGTTPEGLLRAALDSGFVLLDLGAEDVATSHVLPFVEKHRDPFHRLLVWQCIRSELTLLTSDRALRGYRQHGLKLAT